MASSLAFGFLPGGGFAVNTPRDFDRSVPHSYIRLPTGRMPAIYKREVVLTPSPPTAAKAAPAAPEAVPTALEAVLPTPVSTSSEAGERKHKKNRRQRRRAVPPTPRIVGDEPISEPAMERTPFRGNRASSHVEQKKKVVAINLSKFAKERLIRAPFNPKSPGSLGGKLQSKAAKGGAQLAKPAGRQMTARKGRSKRRSTRRLTTQERKEGWKLPSKRHVAATRKQPSPPPQEEYLGDNMFAVLATLSCSQRREIDRTGTLRMPRQALKAEKRREG